MKERVLITGSTGFIGSKTVDALLKQGDTVRILLRPESSLDRALSSKIEVCRASYLDGEALGRAVGDVDRVIHLAGVTGAASEEAFRAGNVVPALNLLEAVKRYNPSLERFVLVSSQAAAGPAASARPGLSESDEPNPVSAYGRSKLLAEQVCLQHAGGIPLTIIRPPAVYGPGDRDVLQVFLMMRKGFFLSVAGSRKQRFSMIHVDDLVAGLLLAARSGAAAGQTYFITSPEACGWDDVINVARSVLGFTRLFRIVLPRPLLFALGTLIGTASAWTGKAGVINRDKVGELVQDYWVCSAEKAKNELGFTAGTPLREGLRSTLQWYLEKGWL